MQTDLERRWDALALDAEKSVFQLYDADHVLKFYIGRETSGARLLLLVTPERPSHLPDLRTIRIQTLKRDDGAWSLLFSLKEDALSSVFALLCEDLIGSSKPIGDSKRAFGYVLKRLSSWRRLMERDGNSLLTPSEIRGLSGELWFLIGAMLNKFGKLEAVQAWTGPDGADQDFQLSGRAWEIKTIRPDAENVQIASENQLFSGVRSIDLVVICLNEVDEKDTETFTLNELVAGLRRQLADDIGALDLFEERLLSARYLARTEYDRPVFKVVSNRFFSVDDGFPRVIPSGLPEGVKHVRYELLIGACKPFEIPPHI